jgi:hypothetical protein
MSLINDALKKAKQAQKENLNPPVPGIGMKPDEEAAEPRSSGGLAQALPIIIAAAVIVALAFGWWTFYRSRHKTVVSATAAPATNVVAVAAVTNAAPPPPPPKPAAPAPVVAPKPKPDLKLQAIMYNPNRPMAMINNKTVMIGEHVSGYKVTEIAVDNVTMVSPTDTQILTMDSKPAKGDH